MAAETRCDAPGAAPDRPPTPVVIGLLGGVASGKSTVGGLFAAHGFRVVDADAHARAVAAEPEVLAMIGAALGPALVASGRLDRAATAALVFRDPAARARLEAILHPRIRQRLLAEIAAARAAGDSVLLDAPLLLEGGLIELCDHTVFVAASDATRDRRAAARGWTAEERALREQGQAPLAEKRARASWVVDNDGDLATTRAQVAALLAAIGASSA